MLSKEDLKVRKRTEQDGLCAITAEPLPEDVMLFDLDRIIPGNQGGKYTLANTRAILPAAHRDFHGNEMREETELLRLRQVMRDYRTVIKLRNGIANQERATQRRMVEPTKEITAMFGEMVFDAETHIAYYKKLCIRQLDRVAHPMIPILLAHRGLGSIYAAEIITTLRIDVATYPSSFWKYVGWAGPSKDRYKKGEKGGGNKAFRSVLYNLGMNFLKNKNEFYAPIYYRRKLKMAENNSVVSHRVNGVTKDVAWKDVNPGRRHNDALRIMGKHFLADLWYVWREVEGLPTEKLYVEEVLKHTHIVNPKDRGWVWEAESVKKPILD